MDTKQCSLCKQTFPLTRNYFYFNKLKADGWEPRCNVCKKKEFADRRARRKAAHLCHCGRELTGHFATCSVCRQRGKSWKAHNPEEWRYRSAFHRAKTRNRVFDHYGNTCACCGEWREEFLTIDHINGGGNAHRRETGRTGITFYAWLVVHNFPEGYRTLCYNCNCSHGHAGYCPHEKERAAVHQDHDFVI